MKTEINLLSPEAKTHRIRLVVYRRINAIMDALLVCLILVVCSYGTVFWVLSTLHASLQRNVVADDAGYTQVKQRIQDINAIIAVIDDRVSQETLWSPLVADIVNTAPPALSIRKLELSGTTRTFSIVGRTAQGSAIVQYQRALEKLSWVDHVVAPLQNFALSPDATVTFTIFRKANQL